MSGSDLFTLLFVSLLGLSLAVELWLGARHARYVNRHRNRVPAPFRRKITLATHRRSADYTIAKARFGSVATGYGSALLLAWTLGGGLTLLESWVQAQSWGPILTGTVFIVGVFVLLELLELPLGFYQTFHIEQRFGFNRMTPALFVIDTLKKLVLMAALGAPLAAAALWFMDRTGTWWWLYVWLLWTGFSLFMVWAFPTLIAPLFNRFRPLRNAPLRARLKRLLARTGFHSRGIYVIDSSRRTTHGNAYFTGLGRAKRIVFFDSLLKSLRPPEVEAVVAHELGHFRLRHIAKRLGLMAALSLAGLAVLGVVSQQAWFYTGLGMSQPSSHAALALFILTGPVFTFFLQPWLSWGSRRHEYEADDFAASETSARSLVSALIKLYRDNAATLTPDPVYSAFYDSHPPALKRIAHLLGK
jgi:STE24 endopeptidase